MDPATSILKKTIPADLKKNKKAIEKLMTAAKDKSLLASFRQRPLQMIPFTPFEDVPESGEDDDTEEKPFLQCIYNFSDKGYRSPWSNRWYVFKKAKGGGEDIEIYERPIPAEEQELRRVESAANEVWDAYTQLYYGKEAIGNAYLKRHDKLKGSFEGIFGVHKHTQKKGSWNSVHVVQVAKPNDKDKTCEYRIDSAVVVSMDPYQKTKISASLTKETTKTCKVRMSSLAGSHLENLGSIMEDVELEFRSKLERVDIPKAIDIMQNVYRKKQASAMAHLIGGDAGDAPSMATGMGLGAGMINEITDMAKKKHLGDNGGNPLKISNPKAGGSAANESDTANEYNSTKSGLKKTSANPKSGFVSPVPDLKSIKLKKGSGPKPALVSPVVSPIPNLKSIKLKKGSAQAKGMTPPISPAPEFLDFRNKLKKTGQK